MSLDEYFATGPAHERPIYEAVFEFLDTLGPVYVEPLSVGIYFKRARSFAYLMPMQRWETLSFSLPRVVRHPLITRKPRPLGASFYIVVNLRSPGDLDDEIRGWLTEAYLCTPE